MFSIVPDALDGLDPRLIIHNQRLRPFHEGSEGTALVEPRRAQVPTITRSAFSLSA